MDAQQLLSDFQARGIKLFPEAGNLAVEPASLLSDADRVAIRACKPELLRILAPVSLEPRHPAYSILETCQHYGVALRIDPATGDLVVGRAGAKAEESTQPWPSLLHALESHLDAMARLVESGWTLTAEFPKEAAA